MPSSIVVQSIVLWLMEQGDVWFDTGRAGCLLVFSGVICFILKWSQVEEGQVPIPQKLESYIWPQFN